ncbi:MAG: hypothetical protein DRI56_00245 [Chloroflexota bacterium]|nr:MAG: hypothetical protein DRI56_00245 [Chloroflexota bacterium]
MPIPKTSHNPENLEDLPPARRRRAERHLIPDDLDAETKEIDKVAQRTSPSFDFFLFSLLSAAILVVGIMLDVPALLVLGVLIAPPLTPVIGTCLGTVTGSFKFFGQRLIATLVASGLVFLVGLLGGFAARVLAIEKLTYAVSHAQVSWSHLILLVVGTIFTVLAVARQKGSPALYSVALAYELFIPLAVAGFGLGNGIPYLWPDGLVVFATHLAIVSLVGSVIFVFLGFRPLTVLGYTLGSVVTILGVILLIGLSGASAIVVENVALPTLSPTPITPTPTSTPVPPTSTPTVTPIPPTLTPTHTATFTPSPTPTSSPTPSPTPIYAIINTTEGVGATIRTAPGFDSPRLTSLLNGNAVEIIDPNPTEKDGYNWVHVRLLNEEGQEGWVLESLILVVPPDADW